MQDESRIDRLTIAGCLRLARTCLDDAAILHAAGSRNASYLAEQSLEQIVRALATSEHIHISRSDAHQLHKVVSSLPASNPFRTALEQLSWIEAYATTFRYVQPSGRIPMPPERTKLAEALSEIGELLDDVSRHFGVDTGQGAADPARTAAPPR